MSDSGASTSRRESSPCRGQLSSGTRGQDPLIDPRRDSPRSITQQDQGQALSRLQGETSVDTQGRSSPRLCSPSQQGQTPSDIETDDPLDKRGIRMLSLDGGGVRGLSSLYTLQRLMDELNHNRKKARRHCQEPYQALEPYQVFDLIGGTSTGGLIAIMLGRLQMSVDECIEEYIKLSEKIFGKKRRTGSIPFTHIGKLNAAFDHERLTQAIRDILNARGLRDDEILSRGDDDEQRSIESEGGARCRVFVCTVRREGSTIVKFRDYQLHGERNEANPTIVEAARATSAASGIFKAVKIGDLEYVDGALKVNNPVFEVWNEAKRIWCRGEEVAPSVKCFISIGTGLRPSQTIEKGVFDFLIKTLGSIATETEQTEEDFRINQELWIKKGRYFRYNVQKGLEGVRLEEHKKKGLIKAATLDYLNKEKSRSDITACGKNLALKQRPSPMEFRDLLRADNRRESNEIGSATKRYFKIPYPSQDVFTGRLDLMSDLNTLMTSRNEYTKIALWGLSGIGKSRLALEAIYQRKEQGDVSIFWVRASTVEYFEEGYRDIAKKIGIPDWDSKDSPIDRLNLVKDWLEEKILGKWILVLDNDDHDLLYGSRHMVDYVPRSTNGTILLTTQNRQIAAKFTQKDKRLSVNKLEKEDSILLLKSLAGGAGCEKDYSNLADTLYNHALALVQAAKYIDKMEISVAHYLKRYRENDTSKNRYLSEEFQDETWSKEKRNPVAVTFAIIFEHIRENHSLAADFLSIMSLFDSQAIPTSLLPSDDDKSFDEAKATLQAYSLITIAGKNLIDMHDLVHLLTRNWLKEKKELNSWLEKATLSISKVLEGSMEDKSRFSHRSYLPHAISLLSRPEMLNDLVSHEHWIGLSPQEKKIAGLGVDLEEQLCDCFVSECDLELAEMLAKKNLKSREMMLTRKSKITLEAVHTLSLVLMNRDKYCLAQPILEEWIEFAENEPWLQSEVWSLKMSLVEALEKQNSAETAQKAETLARDVMKEIRNASQDDSKVVSKDSESTIIQLVGLLRARGEYGEAEELGWQLLRYSEETCGVGSSNTLLEIAWLGGTLAAQKKYQDAEELFRKALGVAEANDRYPAWMRLTIADGMAEVLFHQNIPEKDEEAERILRDMIQKTEVDLGKKNPWLQKARWLLHRVLERRGKTAEAALEYNKLDPDFQKRIDEQGSYHYSNPNGSAYHNDGQGSSSYKPAGGSGGGGAGGAKK